MTNDNINEDIVTEALCSILRKDKHAWFALDEILAAGGVIVEPMVSFETQRVYQHNKRPGLVAFNKDEQELVLIESKFWTSLTADQPNGYLELMKRLPSAKALLFLVPTIRMAELWIELQKRAEQFGIGGKHLRNGVWSAPVGDRGRLVLTSWTTFSKALMRHGRSEEIPDLVGLCKQVERVTSVPPYPPLA